MSSVRISTRQNLPIYRIGMSLRMGMQALSRIVPIHSKRVNLAGAFAWAGENLEDCEGGFAVWAPDVIWNPDYVNPDGTVGAYLMYFCTSSTYMRSVIAYAASKTPEGPYQFVDTLIYSGFTSGDSYATSSTKNVNRKYTSTNIDELIAAGQVTYNEAWFNKGNFNNQLYPNAIDPTIYYDTDGTMYMHTDAGVNFPQIWADFNYKGESKGPFDYLKEKTYGMTEISYIKYLDWKHPWEVIKDWWKTDCYSIFSWSDIKPFIYKFIFLYVYKIFVHFFYNFFFCIFLFRYLRTRLYL